MVQLPLHWGWNTTLRGKCNFSARMQVVIPSICLVFPSFTRGRRLSSLWCSLLNRVCLLEATIDSVWVAVWFSWRFANPAARWTQIHLLFSIWKMCLEMYLFLGNGGEKITLLFLVLYFPEVSYFHFLLSWCLHFAVCLQCCCLHVVA